MNEIAAGGARGFYRRRLTILIGSIIQYQHASGVLFVVAVFASLVVPPIIADVEMHRPLYSAGPGSLSLDMLEAHLSQINFFIAHPFNVLDYPGVVTSLPGHHIVLAWVARLLGYTTVDSTTLPIRMTHAFICGIGSLGLFLFLARLQSFQHRAVNSWMTISLWISVVCSFYFLQSSIYISTDVPALILYIFLLDIAIFRPKTVVVPTIAASAVVFWRQIYAPALIAAFFSPTDPKIVGRKSLIVIVPLTLLLAYIVNFGGFVPANSGGPTDILRNVGGVFPQSVLHVFALLGILLPVYSLIFANEIIVCYRLRGVGWAVPVLFTFVVILWIAVPSTYNYNNGRWGSIVWIVSSYGPRWTDHSLAVLLLALLGAAFSVFLGEVAMKYRQIRPIAVGMCAYLVSQVVVPLAFQRYIEPLILMSLAAIAAGSATVPPWRLALFTILFGAYGLIGILRIYDAFPVGWINQ
jgi:hypothetical protein